MVVYIEIGGESRPVDYNVNALEEYELLTGISILQETTIEVKKMKDLKALAYCGLKHGWLEVHNYVGEYPETIVTVGRWLNILSSGTFVSALAKSLPKGDDNEESKEVDAEKKSVGVTSEP